MHQAALDVTIFVPIVDVCESQQTLFVAKGSGGENENEFLAPKKQEGVECLQGFHYNLLRQVRPAPETVLFENNVVQA